MKAGRLGGGLAAPGAGFGVFSDAVHGDRYLDRPAARLDMSPAFRPADEAFLLLFPRLGGRVLQAVDLIERLTSLGIGVDEPAHAIMRAAAAIPPPVDALFWMLAQGKFQVNAMPLSGITRKLCAGFVPTSPRGERGRSSTALYAPDRVWRKAATQATRQAYSILEPSSQRYFLLR